MSVLELAPVAFGRTATEALHFTTELAKRVEELGYRRIWVAEHHNMPSIASSSPAVLVAHLAASTSAIRVGSGGVMLPNHPPLVVAEQFGTLESLHPGRIDLGIGRAPGTDQRTALALRRTMAGLSAENFPEELVDLIAYFGDTPRGITAVPARGNEPAIWLLGSSGFSAQLAGLLGLPFSFAHHFSSAATVPALELYRTSFRPSRWLSEPYAKIAVNVVCADTDEHARWLAAPAALAFLKLRTGMPEPLTHPRGSRRLPVHPHGPRLHRGPLVRPGHRLPRNRAHPAHQPPRPHRRRRVDAHHHGLRPRRPDPLLRTRRRQGRRVRQVTGFDR
jgi:luciferase family oxidoreductase group 1